jgi:hypothetical protein
MNNQGAYPAEELTGENSGQAEKAIRGKIHPGQRLGTPSQGAPYVVERVDDRGVVLLFGEKETPTPFSWDVLEGTLGFLNLRGWVRIAGAFDTSAESGTLDEYLKGHIQRATAGWVASLFEAAGLVQIDRGRPSRVRAIQGRATDGDIRDVFIPVRGPRPPGRRSKTVADRPTSCPKCFLKLPTSGVCGTCE